MFKIKFTLFVRPLKLLSWVFWRILQTELFAVMVMILMICICLMGISLKDLQSKGKKGVSHV